MVPELLQPLGDLPPEQNVQPEGIPTGTCSPFNRVCLVLFDVNNRIYGPYLAPIGFGAEAHPKAPLCPSISGRQQSTSTRCLSVPLVSPLITLHLLSICCAAKWRYVGAKPESPRAGVLYVQHLCMTGVQQFYVVADGEAAGEPIPPINLAASSQYMDHMHVMTRRVEVGRATHSPTS
jgi:hypothetical protein